MRIAKSPGLACGLCVGDKLVVSGDRIVPETHQRVEPAARVEESHEQPVARVPLPAMHELVRDARA